MNKIMDLSDRAIESLAQGSILVCGDSRKPNLMTIGWSTIGIMWGKPVIAVPVRLSRHSHGLMEKESEFTVCFPKPGKLKEEIILCGTESGRNIDKVKETGLTIIDSNRVEIGNILECPVVFECKVVGKMDLTEDFFINNEIIESFYPEQDFHTLFYGEILDAYER